MVRKYSLLWLLAICSILFLAPWTAHSGDMQIVYSDQVAVLVYHQIDDKHEGSVTITPRLFREQLHDLKERGYHFITLEQFRAFMKGGPIPSNAVLVTFDDGYESFYSEAFPILEAMNIPAVNFVITGTLEQPGSTGVSFMSKDEIRKMTERMKDIEVQSHTHKLHALASNGGALLTTKLANDGHEETDADFQNRIMKDLRESREALAALQQKEPDSFAYPFGAYDKQTTKWMAEAGIHYAFTTQSGLADRSSAPLEIPRINAGSPFVRKYSVNNLIIRQLHQAKYKH